MSRKRKRRLAPGSLGASGAASPFFRRLVGGNMKSITRRWLIAALPAVLLHPAFACHPADSEDVTEPTRSAEVDIEDLDGLRIEFALENNAATPAEIEAAARHVETLADVAAAKVRIEARSEDATHRGRRSVGPGLPHRGCNRAVDACTIPVPAGRDSSRRRSSVRRIGRRWTRPRYARRTRRTPRWSNSGSSTSCAPREWRETSTSRSWTTATGNAASEVHVEKHGR